MNWTGLSQGLDRGVRLGLAIDQGEMQKQQAERRGILTDMQIDALKDETARKQALRDTQASIYALSQFKNNGPQFAEHLKANPDLAAQIDESMGRVGQMLVDSRGVKGRKYSGLVPIDKNTFAIEVQAIDDKGNPYSAPLTENGSTDPNDKVMTFTLDDAGQLISAVDAEITGLETKMIGLGSDYPLRAQADKEARQQGIADKKDMARFEAGLAKDKIGYEYGLKSKLAKEKGSGGSNWTLDQAEKHIKSLVATGMGLNSDMAQWDADQEREFARKTNDVLTEWRNNPDAGISSAYAKIIGKEVPGEKFKALDRQTQEALAVDSLAARGEPKEDKGFIGSDEYSKQQIRAEVARLSMENDTAQQGITGANGQETQRQQKMYKATVNGKEITFTDEDIRNTAENRGMTEEAVRRQLGIQ